MVAPVELTRRDVPASDLRRFARQLKTGREACRLLAIAMVLEGASRSEAAASNGMDVQTLRGWVLRYNADGVAGLRDRGGQGRRPVLSQEQLAALKAAVQSVAPVRSSLIRKGMTFSPAHGDIDFTVPLFDAFMRRAMPMEKGAIES